MNRFLNRVRSAVRSRSRRRADTGLTLVEIIVVLVILVLLFSWLTGGLLSQGEKAKAKLNELQMQKVKQAIGQYQLMNNQLPPDLRSLATCPANTQACVPVGDESLLVDAWGTEFKYTLENGGRSYRLTSLGSDRNDGGSGVEGDMVVTGP